MNNRKIVVHILFAGVPVPSSLTGNTDDTVDIQTHFAPTTETAIELFHQYPTDVVVMPLANDHIHKIMLRKIVQVQNNDVNIIEESTDTAAAIRQVISTIVSQNKPAIQVIDDALKDAKYNIETH